MINISALKKIERHEISVGKHVIWLQILRGGYGYTWPVKAKVVRLDLDGDVAIVEVTRCDGEIVRRRVKRENLRTER